MSVTQFCRAIGPRKVRHGHEQRAEVAEGRWEVKNGDENEGEVKDENKDTVREG